MCPRSPALQHPFAETLLACAENSCQVGCGLDWSNNQIAATLKRGPCMSAKELSVAKYVWQEAKEKVK